MNLLTSSKSEKVEAAGWRVTLVFVFSIEKKAATGISL
jgi:hypothetical protein